MEKEEKIYVAGHNGLVGSAIVRVLKKQGYKNLILKKREELDLTDQIATSRFFSEARPDYVFLAAAMVGGIKANSDYPADFILNNLTIQDSVISSAHKYSVKKLLFLGSSCIYPRDCPQPIKEEYLLTGPLESTNDAYAIAKIAGIKMCQSFNKQYHTNYISVMPTNLYGPNDNFDLETSHVFPALVRKFHESKINNEPEVVLWGTGKARREFLFVDDLASACVYLMNTYNDSDIVNIGTGEDLTIKELAILIKDAVGYKGKIVHDLEKPDGTPQKLLDVSKLHSLGWKHETSLKSGIEKTYKWFVGNNFS